MVQLRRVTVVPCQDIDTPDVRRFPTAPPLLTYLDDQTWLENTSNAVSVHVPHYHCYSSMLVPLLVYCFDSTGSIPISRMSTWALVHTSSFGLLFSCAQMQIPHQTSRGFSRDEGEGGADTKVAGAATVRDTLLGCSWEAMMLFWTYIVTWYYFKVLYILDKDSVLLLKDCINFIVTDWCISIWIQYSGVDMPYTMMYRLSIVLAFILSDDVYFS